MEKILIIDTDFLCHRAFHTTGMLSHRKIRTGVVYGVLREISFLLHWYKPTFIVWCFDSKESLRRDAYKGYKSSRKDKKRTPEEIKAKKHLVSEIKCLRRDYLPSLGFNNVIQKRGYEADDIIASVVINRQFWQKVVIVAADADLYQLLGDSVKIYNPIKKAEYTLENFMDDWGLHPVLWSRVKAIAGCKSDDIPGVPGVGEKTAATWLKGNLKPESKKYQAILDNLDLVNRNTPLVTLPYEGTGTFTLKADKLSSKRWYKVCEELGISRMSIETPPFSELKQRQRSTRETKKTKGKK